jgi:hypothetical protein
MRDKSEGGDILIAAPALATESAAANHAAAQRIDDMFVTTGSVRTTLSVHRRRIGAWPRRVLRWRFSRWIIHGNIRLLVRRHDRRSPWIAPWRPLLRRVGLRRRIRRRARKETCCHNLHLFLALMWEAKFGIQTAYAIGSKITAGGELPGYGASCPEPSLQA